MRAAVKSRGARAAFLGMVGGRVVEGLGAEALARLAGCGAKVSTRDLAVAAARGEDGGTTVAATAFLARQAGLAVVATGGIGGVHRRSGRDVSPDLVELVRTPVIVVCSGPKAVLDLSATVEALESLGVALLGWGTRELPAFWSAESGIPLARSVRGAEEVAAIWRAAREIEVPGALLVCVPPPEEAALSRAEAERAVVRAVAEAEVEGIGGPDLTPFLLGRVGEITGGRSVAANRALLVRNAATAAEIAVALAGPRAVRSA